MPLDRDEIDDRVSERAEEVDDRLDHIPDSYSMPDLEDMTIGTAKKFHLSLVYVDIHRFTEYTSEQDDKDVLFMLNLFIPEIIEIVRDLDGYFEKNTGDGILAYFGAGETNSQKAHLVFEYLATVKYALANHVNPKLEQYDIEPIQIKAGAAVGDVYISRTGVNRLNRRTAVGMVANIGADLEEKAAKNEYFVSHGIKRLAERGGCDWAEYLTDMGSHGTYRWRPNSDAEWEDAHYWNFTGGWADTDWENLK
jgi:class 3 adenylate cyclase